MKDTFLRVLAEMEEKRDSILITIVAEDGSVPRGKGSQMLVGANGRLAGSVGGGTIENLSVEKARQLLTEGRSTLHRFMLHKNPDEDIGMVCGGEITAWFQFIPGSDRLWEAVAREAVLQLERHRKGWLILSTEGGPPSLLGEDGAALAGRDVSGELLTPDCRGEWIGESFSLPLPAGERAVIFGGGHIAQALVPLLRTVGFRPVVFDCRPDFARPDLFPAAESVVCGDYLRIESSLRLKEDDFIVVMTNGHSHDFEVQEQILRREFAYVGVIGSSRKTAAVNARLMAAGIPEEATRKIHTPIGTKIKAVTPAEIAVSIAGEMICERAARREAVRNTGARCPMQR